MKLRIEHLTRHRYSGPVSFSRHILYLRPIDGHLRRVQHFSVATIPPSKQSYIRDIDGNTVLRCDFGLTESEILEFRTHIDVEINDDNPYNFLLESYAVEYPFDYHEADLKALQPYLSDDAEPEQTKVRQWFAQTELLNSKPVNTVQLLNDLNQTIRRDICYLRRDEEGIQTPEHTLSLRSGSCRDIAVLFIAAVRQLGLAARFVSGYLYDPPQEDSSEHLFNRALGSMHAWAEVYLPGAGWKGFDPTNGILANSYFIPTGLSHAPEVVAPIQGNYFSKQMTESSLELALHIEELKGDLST
jgi:transglutaminase-like putative cysteine protease